MRCRYDLRCGAIASTPELDSLSIADGPLDLELLVAEAFRIEAGSLGLCAVNSKWFVLVRSEQEKNGFCKKLRFRETIL